MALSKLMTIMAAGTALSLAACQNDTPKTDGSSAAADAAGEKTLASALGDATKFAAAAKAVGLDATLAGPGPYTVLVPDDAAFDRLPPGALDGLMKEESRPELTGVLTYHILPGVILAEDIDKAIDANKGSVTLPTMGGGTITATRDGDAIMLSDSSGTKAKLTSADEKLSNGVIHRINAVLMPS